MHGIYLYPSLWSKATMFSSVNQQIHIGIDGNTYP